MSVHRRPQSARQLLEGSIDAVEVGDGEAIRHSAVSSGMSVRSVHGDVAAKPFGIVCIAQGTPPNKPQHVDFWPEADLNQVRRDVSFQGKRT